MAELVTDEQMTEKENLDVIRISQHTQIDDNTTDIATISSDVNEAIVSLDDVVDGIENDVTDIESDANSYVINKNNHIIQLTSLQDTFNNLPSSMIYNFTMFGDINSFYPLPFNFNLNTVKRFLIYRGKNDDGIVFNNASKPTGSVRVEIEGYGGSASSNILGFFNVLNHSYSGTKCIAVVNRSLLCSNGSQTEYTMCDSMGGMYLRGGISYTIDTDDEDILTYIQTYISEGIQDNWSFGEYVATSLLEASIEIMDSEVIVIKDNYLEGRSLGSKFGDIAIYTGGSINNVTAINNVQRSIISTGADSVDIGVMTSTLRWHGFCSNGVNDNAIVLSGCYSNSNYSTDIQSIIISTGTDTESTNNICVNANGVYGSTSNGTGDTIVKYSGHTYSHDVNIIESGIISTGASMIQSGALDRWVLFTSATSNLTKDVGVIVGGRNSSVDYLDIIKTSIISTSSSATDTGVMESEAFHIASASNGTDDIALHFGGHDGSILNNIRRSIISTGGDSTTVGSLITEVSLPGAVSNSVGDTSLIVAGESNSGMTNILQTTIVSIGTTSTITGNLTISANSVRSCSNG